MRAGSAVMFGNRRLGESRCHLVVTHSKQRANARVPPVSAQLPTVGFHATPCPPNRVLGRRTAPSGTQPARPLAARASSSLHGTPDGCPAPVSILHKLEMGMTADLRRRA